MNTPREVVHFGKGDAPILRAAARLFRDHGPKPDVLLFGSIYKGSRGAMRRRTEQSLCEHTLTGKFSQS